MVVTVRIYKFIFFKLKEFEENSEIAEDDGVINVETQPECLIDEEVKNNDEDRTISSSPISKMNITHASKRQWDLPTFNDVSRLGKETEIN